MQSNGIQNINIVAIIQARMGASRLLGKTLMPLSEKPVIEHIIDRVNAVDNINDVVVATSLSPKDDPLADHLEKMNTFVFRGSEDDVLSRFAEAAHRFNADIVVRITGDDPLKDPAVIEKVVSVYLNRQSQFDYVSNVNPPTFPEGQDTEVFSAESLQRADQEATASHDREHVTPFFYKNPHLFRLHNVTNLKDLSGLRWTLDTWEDYEFIQCIYQALYEPGEIFGMTETLAWLNNHPEVEQINNNVKRSQLYVRDNS